MKLEIQTSLICTTNLTAQELKKPADVHRERIYSRLYQMCYFYEVKGQDRRRAQMIAHSAAYKKLLEA